MPAVCIRKIYKGDEVSVSCLALEYMRSKGIQIAHLSVRAPAVQT